MVTRATLLAVLATACGGHEAGEPAGDTCRTVKVGPEITLADATDYRFQFAGAIYRTTMVVLSRHAGRSDFELTALDESGRPVPGSARSLQGSSVFQLNDPAVVVGDVLGTFVHVRVDDAGPGRCVLGFYDLSAERAIRAPSDVTGAVNDQGEPQDVDDCFIFGERDGFLTLWRERKYGPQTHPVHFARRFGRDGTPSGERFALTKLDGPIEKAASDGIHTLLVAGSGGTELWLLEGNELANVPLPGAALSISDVTSVRGKLLVNQFNGGSGSGSGAGDWTLEWWLLGEDGLPQAGPLSKRWPRIGPLGDGFVALEEVDGRVLAHAIDEAFRDLEGAADLPAVGAVGPAGAAIARVTVAGAPDDRSSFAFIHRSDGPFSVVPIACVP